MFFPKLVSMIKIFYVKVNYFPLHSKWVYPHLAVIDSVIIGVHTIILGSTEYYYSDINTQLLRKLHNFEKWQILFNQ